MRPFYPGFAGFLVALSRAVLVQAAGARPALVMPFFEWLLGRPPDVRPGGISAWRG